MHKVSRSSVQLSTQPSPLAVASPDSSYIFLEKGNKTTSTFRESFNIIKVELPLFSPRFLQYQHTLSSINSIKNAKNFLLKVLIAAQFLFCQFLTNYLLKGEYKIFFSILVHTSAELSSFPHIDYKSLMLGLHDCRSQTGCDIWSLLGFDLNQIHLKNKIFSFRQLLSWHGFESH